MKNSFSPYVIFSSMHEKKDSQYDEENWNISKCKTSTASYSALQGHLSHSNSQHDDKILLKMFSLTGDPMAPFGPGVPG